MKRLLILFIILTTSITTAQEMSIGFDPGVLDEGIDISFAAKADTYILKTKFHLGIAFEYFPAIDYFSYHGQFDFPLYYNHPIWIIQDIETRIGVEYGKILRWNIDTHKGYPEHGTSTFRFRTYGANASICFWFGYKVNFGWYTELNYKYRYDNVWRWGDAATEWEYSVRTGFKYKFN